MFKFNNQKILKNVNKNHIKINSPLIKSGDFVNIGFKIIEQDKERIQFYKGIVISKKNSLINATLLVRKIVQGIGVERTFLINSPQIMSIRVIKSSKIRRSKLYYLCKLKGKTSRLKQKTI